MPILPSWSKEDDIKFLGSPILTNVLLLCLVVMALRN
jgi:hypothetical protein